MAGCLRTREAASGVEVRGGGGGRRTLWVAWTRLPIGRSGEGRREGGDATLHHVGEAYLASGGPAEWGQAEERRAGAPMQRCIGREGNPHHGARQSRDLLLSTRAPRLLRRFPELPPGVSPAPCYLPSLPCASSASSLASCPHQCSSSAQSACIQPQPVNPEPPGLLSPLPSQVRLPPGSTSPEIRSYLSAHLSSLLSFYKLCLSALHRSPDY
ncbi:uncharacterized protein CANTADRAFT_214947 [Suhomyces tanzawaensis NRRL Y-17324]|uniref:Uncharacterized protein n=1 Tax=Suhomyces tanzawaensis NRRL Y-17324 TaxID=984487 RepID=A0A1E4SJN7_9ASCO|nr:uncharacterized protein CANTADRAFT_214947 [Suhomyces tanzawaensis NRRL Y-17324]ODV79708.1 hypothetical protein CANTADRAFT_214947 [Suhomyces tanzawaensis NRRL Y-17324]